MRTIFVAVGMTVLLSAPAYSQRAAVGDPTAARGLQQNRGTPEPIQPNGTARGVGGDMGNVLGVKPITGAGQTTAGVGVNTKGFGNQITGYGQGTGGYKGIDCRPTAYPRSPFCPPETLPQR
jgi:hypothetical protein